MKRILGIDPGSRVTGYGIVDTQGGKTTWVGSGCIRISGDSLAERLQQLCQCLNEILDTHGPDEVAIEQVFVSRNVDSALKLGQARGAAISAVAMRNIPVHEYTARQVKKAVVGKGNAEKAQVQHMIVRLLGLTKTPPEDAADALAVAMCHAHTGATVQQLASILDKTVRTRRGRLR